MKRFIEKLRKKLAGKELPVILGILTLTFVIRYLYILLNPVSINEAIVFPYKKKTLLYVSVLLVLDFACFMQYKHENICELLFFLVDKIINKLKICIIRVKKVIAYSWVKIILSALFFVLISFGVYKDVAVNYDKADYRERVIPYTSVCDLTGEIVDGMIIEQTFVTELDEIKGVYLRTATYARNNNSNIVIALLSMDGVLLGQQAFPALDVNDNDFTYFGFQTPINTKNAHQIKCSITAEGNAGGGNGITLYRSNADFYKKGELQINGNVIQGDCYLELFGNQKDSVLISIIYVCVCAGILLFIVLSGYLLLKKQNVKLEFVFVVIALIVGSIFIFIVPPYSEHDGEAHFNTIYKYSNKILGYEVSDAPRFIQKEDKDIFGQKFGYPPSRGDYYSIKNLFLDESEYEGKQYEVNELGLALQDYPVLYLFSVIGLTIGRVLQMNIISIFYLTRFFNLLEYIVLTFFAIKLIPVFRRTFFAITILPMSLLQAASVSYDATVMGVVFLFVAMCLYLIHNDCKKRYMAGVIILAGSFFYIKGGAYFPLIGILCCIPVGKKFTTKQKVSFLIAVAGCIMFAVISGFVDSGKAVSISETTAISVNYPITYSVMHPVWFMKILCRTFYSMFETYFKGLFGMSIFGIDVLSTPLILCVPVIVLLLALKRQENGDAISYVSGWQRMVIVLCMFCSIFMICFGAVSWTEVGSYSIWGIQGRYFIPLILPAMFLGCKSTNTKVQNPNNMVYCMCVVDGIYVLFTLMQIFSI